MLTDKSGPLQGIDANSVVRQAYGRGTHYDASIAGTDHVGAIVRTSDGEVLDHVVEIHEV